ncbi:MAG: methyl-accepting chemotaxis protein [Polyangiaceae bacterium]|jgi:methyl-accepting chemotaxis protein
MSEAQAGSELQFSELHRVVDAVKSGRLGERMSVAGLAPEAADVARSVNAILDALAQPIETMSRYGASLASGSVPERVPESGGGTIASLAVSLNEGAQGLRALFGELERMGAEHTRGDIDVVIPADKFKGDFAQVARSVNEMVGGHIAVKKKAMACVNEFAKGNFEATLEKFPGKKAFINDTIELLRANLISLIAQMRHMSQEHDKGDIDVMIPVDKFQGDFARVAQGINEMVSGHIAVKKKAMACIAEFGKGNFEAPLEKFPGKKAFINDTIEQVRVNLKALVVDSAALVQAALAGQLSTRADASRHQGDFRKIVQGVNDTLDGVIGPLNVAADYVARIAAGNVPPKITDKYNGDFNTIKNNLNTCIDAVNALVADAAMLSKAAVDGRLATRADASKHQGDYGKIVHGVNETLDAVIGPLNVAADYVARIAAGNIPPKITDKYSGDFNTIKNNLNMCIDAVNALVADAAMLSKAAVEGKLATRADASKHQGDYGKIVHGVNETLDAVIGPLNVAADYVARISAGNIPPKITDKYNGDFNTIKNNLNTCIEAVNALVADAAMLSKAAVEGKLATRADASKHQGDFRKVVQGVDDTLDAVIGPLKVAAEYVARISRGDIPAKIADNYNGDFNAIKSNLNTCVDAVNALVADAGMLSNAAVEGKLATRADASKHQGDFRKIVQGVDDTLDAVIGPLNVAADYVARISKGDIPARIVDSYNGDFNTIKNNLNTCIDAVNALVSDANMLAAAAVEGKLKTRAEATKHQGDFRKIVAGINGTLDSVIEPMNNIAEAIASLGNNDMSIALKGAYHGDFLAIKESFDNALSGLNSTLSQVVDAVDQVGQSAEQLSVASRNMASAAEEQSQASEEVTSSLSETDSQVKANTENARAANQLVEGTSQAASEGKAKMASMMESMDSINASAQNIAKIIKVIDEIAFQTNLLALNAAVEAARAGQHGRGFAVVAQEVRNLAGRSAKAARETAEMIEDSIKRVGEGVEIAKDTSEALNQMVTNVVKVKDLVAEIATASAEQSRGVSQANATMEQVAKGAQDGSQQAQELASASTELTSLAEHMREEVRRFKLRERQAGAFAGGIPGLEGLTPDMIAQLRAMLASQGKPPALKSGGGNGHGNGNGTANGVKRGSPKAVLPLDRDERGFGKF